MANSHVGHNAAVANDVILVNGASLAGHASIGDRAILGAYCSIHQFCMGGAAGDDFDFAGMNVDFPPFFLTMATNTVHQLIRWGCGGRVCCWESINVLRRMFQLAFREEHRRPLLREALEEPATGSAAVPEVNEMIGSCKSASRLRVARFIPWSRGQNVMHEGS